MPEPLSSAILSWVTQAVGRGAEIASIHRLLGATSSTLYSVDVSHRGRAIALVLRLFTNREWLAEEPDVPAHEAENLRKAAAADVPTPELVACDPTGERCGVPAILMTRLPGRVQLKPANLDLWLHQLAEAALPIHAIDVGAHRWQYAPYNDVTRLQVPDWSRHPDLWERAIEIVNGPWPPAPERFIHRDYHPTNVLFQGSALSGVVDWANACKGPAGIDVAWCRSNLAGSHGVEAADRFLDAYRSLAGVSFVYDPFWDLMVVIEGLPGPPDVYPPWIEFGLDGLTAEMMRERSDAYLVSVTARF